jgi:signal peptidase II
VLGRKWIAFGAGTAGALTLDQAAKWLVAVLLPAGGQFALVGGFLAVAPLRQPGAAFGLLDGLDPELARMLLPALAAGAALLLVPLLWRAPRGDVLSGTALGLIAGGAASNLVDRLQLGAALEFLKLNFGIVSLPEFNLGDCSVAAGMALLLLDLVAADAGARPPADGAGRRW